MRYYLTSVPVFTINLSFSPLTGLFGLKIAVNLVFNLKALIDWILVESYDDELFKLTFCGGVTPVDLG